MKKRRKILISLLASAYMVLFSIYVTVKGIYIDDWWRIVIGLISFIVFIVFLVINVKKIRMLKT